MKRIIFAVLFFVVFAFLPTLVFAHSVEARKAEFISKLSKFFPRSKISSIFSDKRLALDYSVLPPPPLPPPRTEEERKQREEEDKRKLDEKRARLLGHDSVLRGIKYLNDHKKAFVAAENKRGVDRYIIASILRNETNFGPNIGAGHPVINTLYSLYVLMPEWRKFAVRELSCFIKVADASGWEDVFSVPGSNRGAFGYAQFIPCSFPLAVDGNGDGKIDLFNHNDAIFSVENYLARFWSERPKDQRKAILKYNNSLVYLEDVHLYRELLMLYDSSGF